MQVGTLHGRIKKFRQARGLTQAALARFAAVSRSYILRLERGERSPSVRILQRLADALGVPVARFFISDRQWEKVGRFL